MHGAWSEAQPGWPGPPWGRPGQTVLMGRYSVPEHIRGYLMSRMDDVLNNGGAGKLAQHLAPADYVAGRGYSEHLSEEIRQKLDSMTGDDVDAAADSSWGFLTQDAEAEAEWQFNNMMREGKL